MLVEFKFHAKFAPVVKLGKILIQFYTHRIHTHPFVLNADTQSVSSDEEFSSQISSHLSDSLPIRESGSTIARGDSRPEPLPGPHPARTRSTNQYFMPSDITDRSSRSQATRRFNSVDTVDQWLSTNEEVSAQYELDDGIGGSRFDAEFLDRDSTPYGPPVDYTSRVPRNPSRDEEQRAEYDQWRGSVLVGDSSSSVGLSQPGGSLRSSLFPLRSHFLERTRQTWRPMQRPAYTPSTVVPLVGSFEHS